MHNSLLFVLTTEFPVGPLHHKVYPSVCAAPTKLSQRLITVQAKRVYFSCLDYF
jgi:hypothetical protein